MKNRNRMIVNCVTASLMYYWSLPALAEQSSSEIKIVRDEYGMPHIYANDTWHLFYGYGYVVAQDRLFQMEMARRSTQGTAAEVLGKDFVKFDKDIRRNYWPDAIRAQIAALSPEDMSILQGYADGMNAWIDKVNTNPETLLPKQFNTFGFTPKRWEPFDVAMIFVGTMANRFSDSTSEIDNLALLTALKDKYGVSQGMAVFNQLKWLVNPSAPTTIAVQESSYPLKFNQQNSQTAALLPRYDLPAPMLDRPAKGADGSTAGVNSREEPGNYCCTICTGWCQWSGGVSNDQQYVGDRQKQSPGCESNHGKWSVVWLVCACVYLWYWSARCWL